MNLFNSALSVKKFDSNPLIYSTIFGEIYFNLTINNKEIGGVKSLEIISFNNSIVSRWDLENCHVEFLQTHFKPKIPTSMHVDNCLAGIWRIKCFKEDILPVFKTTLNPNSLFESNGELESGEGVISIRFENHEMQLFIGTEDEDYLNNRAFLNEWMPNHLSGKISSDSIKPLKNGLEVSLPILKKQDCIQIQFVVASSSNKHHKDSCWFAVEQSPEYILKEANVT